MSEQISIEWGAHKGEEWNRLYASISQPAALQQSYAYGEMARQAGAEIRRAIIMRGAEPIGLFQATCKKLFKLYRLTLGMRGPVWLVPLSETEKVEALRMLKRSHKGLLLIMPEEQAGFHVRGLRRVMSGYHTCLIDLRQDEESLLGAQHGKWRNRLRAAQKAALRVDAIGGKPENYAWLLEEEIEQSRRVGYAALSPVLVPFYQQYAGKKSVLGMQAWHDNQRVAGMLFLLHGHSATYHIGWSSDEGKAHNAHNLLLWEALLRLKEAGICWLDMGGVNDKDGEGILRFKRGAGGETLSLCGTYL